MVGMLGLGVGVGGAGMNGAFVAGWALAVAAAAGVPGMVGRIFWRGATRRRGGGGDGGGGGGVGGVDVVVGGGI